MSPFKSAVSAVHFALVSALFIPTAMNSPAYGHVLPEMHHPSWHSYYGKRMKPVAHHLRLSSENDRCGNERPGVIPVPEWEEQPEAGEVLLGRFERLYEAFKTREESEKEGREGEVDSGYDEGR